MRTERTIRRLLKEAYQKLGHLPRHPQAHLFPYEIAVIGMLSAHRRCSFRAFYRWLKGDCAYLFSGPIPERTRLIRLLTQHAFESECFLAKPSGDLVCDAFGVEMVHPWRSERARRKAAWRRRQHKPARMPKTLARKGFSNHRWIIGAKLGILLRLDGQVVDFGWDSANVADNSFNFLAKRYPANKVLGDTGYAQAEGQPENLVLCKRGEQNQRMVVETTFSMLTLVCGSKRLWRRTERHITAHFTYLLAGFNCFTSWTPGRRSLAQYSL